MNLRIDQEQVKLFFSTVWPDQGNGFLSVSSSVKNNLSTKFFSHPIKPDLLCNAIERWSSRNIWFTIGLIGERPDRGRGKVEHISGLPGLVADIDCSEGIHNEKNLPSKEEALQFVSEIPFKPSMVVWSGGGLQVYWLFSKPWIFCSPADRAKASGLSLKWQHYLVAMGKKKGWKLDSTGSIEHLFRIPGTFNHKGEPVPVEIMEVSK